MAEGLKVEKGGVASLSINGEREAYGCPCSLWFFYLLNGKGGGGSKRIRVQLSLG